MTAKKADEVSWEVVIRELWRVRGKGAGWPGRQEVVDHLEAIRAGLEGKSRPDGSYSAVPWRNDGEEG